MSLPSEYANYYLERMRQGHGEDGFFSLIEADVAVLPILMEALAKEENRGIRGQIVRCIWQHRLPQVLGFLAEVLHDPESAVWQEALDGLVAIGGSEAILALHAARARIPAAPAKGALTIEWIEEALEQLRARGTEYP